MHVYISKPIPDVRFTKTVFVRNPVSIKVKGSTSTLLNQNPSTIGSVHVTPYLNVALVLGQWGSFRFVYIVKAIRASSMREKSLAAFSYEQNA